MLAVLILNNLPDCGTVKTSGNGCRHVRWLPNESNGSQRRERGLCMYFGPRGGTGENPPVTHTVSDQYSAGRARQGIAQK